MYHSTKLLIFVANLKKKNEWIDNSSHWGKCRSLAHVKYTVNPLKVTFFSVIVHGNLMNEMKYQTLDESCVDGTQPQLPELLMPGGARLIPLNMSSTVQYSKSDICISYGLVFGKCRCYSDTD